MALFHETHGDNVMYSPDGQLAMTVPSFVVSDEKTEVYSVTPVREGREFIIQVHCRDKQHVPVYRVGVTTFNPALPPSVSRSEETWSQAWWVGPSSGRKYRHGQCISKAMASPTSERATPFTEVPDRKRLACIDLQHMEPQMVSVGDVVSVARGPNGEVTVRLNNGTPWGAPTFETGLDDINYMWAVVALGKGTTISGKETRGENSENIILPNQTKPDIKPNWKMEVERHSGPAINGPYELCTEVLPDEPKSELTVEEASNGTYEYWNETTTGSPAEDIVPNGTNPELKARPVNWKTIRGLFGSKHNKK